MLKKVLYHYPIYIVFVLYIIFSYLTYSDYAITADERRRYNMGQNYLDLIKGKEVDKEIFKDHYPLYVATLRFVIQDTIYEYFHLFNLLFNSLIILISYIFFYLEYKNKWYALIAPLLIILTPRFFGDLPANPKDTPFAIFYFLSTLLIYFYTKKQSPSFVFTLFLGIVLGITQSMRIIGYSLYLIFLINLFVTHKKININNLKNLTLITLISHIFMFLTWPFLHLGFSSFLTVLNLSSDFSAWDNKILYLGQFINKEQRPWHYLFVWLLVSTPIYILIMHFISFIYIKKDQLLKYLITTIYINFVLYLVINPVIYNGIRHFLFLLPLISATATIVIIKTIKYKLQKLFLIGYIALIIFQLYQLHPYEYIYFNPIAKKIFNIEKTFETDYWSTTYKEASLATLKYIKDNKLRDIKVYPCSMDFALQLYTDNRIKLKDRSLEANIIICDSEEDYYRQNTGKIIYEVKRSGMILNTVRMIPENTK